MANHETPTAAPRSPSATIAGITLSHADKVLYPEIGLTKRDLAAYAAAVAAHMVPHLSHRPLSLVRCPDGWSATCFYQKHSDPHVDAAVTRVTVPEAGGTATYFSADSTAAAVALVQWGVVELHPWGARTPRLDRPDRLVFDLDPAEDVPWTAVATAATDVRAVLDSASLKSFVKTTGGKGLHVVVPIQPTLNWSHAKEFAKAVADRLAKDSPNQYTAAASKRKRPGKIFVDYLRNAEGATAVAPYSPRARASAPVATPIAWSELGTDVRHAYFNVRNVPDRLDALSTDPWADFLATRQTLSQAVLRRFAITV